MEVTTLFLAGLSTDATYRELENLVRFFPGYEAMKVTTGKGKSGGTAMFVKFDSVASAMECQKALNAQPFDTAIPDQVMRVEMARSDMKTHASGVPPPPRYDPPPETTWSETGSTAGQFLGKIHALNAEAEVGGAHGAAYSGPPAVGRKRHRGSEDPLAIDTLVLLGQLEKGFTEHQLEDFFAQVPGFVAFKANSRVGGGFVKFSSPALAHEALETAAQAGIEAQMARSSMNTPGYGGHGGGAVPPPATMDEPAEWTQPPPPAYPPAPAWNGGIAPPKRARGGEPSGSVDTLVLLGQLEKGFTDTQLEDFFTTVPGFLAYKSNARVGGGFVKFASPQLAVEAIEIAASSGIEAQMARSSMNTT